MIKIELVQPVDYETPTGCAHCCWHRFFEVPAVVPGMSIFEGESNYEFVVEAEAGAIIFYEGDDYIQVWCKAYTYNKGDDKTQVAISESEYQEERRSWTNAGWSDV